MQCMLLFHLGNTHLWIHLVFVCFIGRIPSECLCQWYQLAFIRIHSQFVKFHQTGNKLSFQLSCISLWRERRGSHQGMSLPILVHLLFVMKKPTTGSVTAPQTLPMNSTMEAWKALICGAQQGHAGTHRHTFPYQLIFFICESRFQCAYLSNVEQVDLQEESCGAGSHFLGRAADGKTQFAA